MTPFERILVPVDFSESADEALRLAASLADAFGADLHVLHVLPPAEGGPPGASADEQSELARHVRCVAGASADAFTVAVTRAEAVASAIGTYAAEHCLDLIVMGSHGYRGIRRVLLGSVTERVLRLAASDVLTVRPHEGDAPPPRVPRRVLVPVDFSPPSREALRHGRVLAGRFGAALDVLHVIAPLPFLGYQTGTVSLEDLVPDYRQRTLEALREFVAESGGPAMPASLHVREGHVEQGILDFAAERRADVIVMAAHARTAAERFFLGSVAERVTRSAACPVYVVKQTAPAVAAGVAYAGGGEAVEA